jgi:hypothetical protein
VCPSEYRQQALSQCRPLPSTIRPLQLPGKRQLAILRRWFGRRVLTSTPHQIRPDQTRQDETIDALGVWREVMVIMHVAQADSPSAGGVYPSAPRPLGASTPRPPHGPGNQGPPAHCSALQGRAEREGGREEGRKEGRKGKMEWENDLESNRRKVGVSMEKCCSNRLEQSCHLWSGLKDRERRRKAGGGSIV